MCQKIAKKKDGVWRDLNQQPQYYGKILCILVQESTEKQ